jgi:hypothetical protein
MSCSVNSTTERRPCCISFMAAMESRRRSSGAWHRWKGDDRRRRSLALLRYLTPNAVTGHREGEDIALVMEPHFVFWYDTHCVSPRQP